MTKIVPNSAVTDVNQSPNFTAGRPAGNPNVIIIHHWGVTGQSHQNVVNYLCSTTNHGASAHYVASAGRVTQLVSDKDRAWHAGRGGNPRGIGIECRPEMSDGDFKTVAALIAAIRSEWGDLPIKGHRDYMQTACPGKWYNRLSALDAMARGIIVGPVAPDAETVKEAVVKHIIFSTTAGHMYLYSPWSHTHSYIPDAQTLSDLRTVIGRAGGQILDWPSLVKNRKAFGAEVKDNPVF